MSPARLWHQEMEARIRYLLQAASRYVATARAALADLERDGLPRG